MTTTTDVKVPSTTEPATVAQVMYLAKLIVWRGIKDLDVPDTMTEAECSALIDRARETPAPRRPGAPVGYYRHEGEVYEVRERREGGTYAQLLRCKDGRVSWKFIPGKVTALDKATPITAEDVERVKAEMRMGNVAG